MIAVIKDNGPPVFYFEPQDDITSLRVPIGNALVYRKRFAFEYPTRDQIAKKHPGCPLVDIDSVDEALDILIVYKELNK